MVRILSVSTLLFFLLSLFFCFKWYDCSRQFKESTEIFTISLDEKEKEINLKDNQHLQRELTVEKLCQLYLESSVRASYIDALRRYEALNPRDNAIKTEIFAADGNLERAKQQYMPYLEEAGYKNTEPLIEKINKNKPDFKAVIKRTNELNTLMGKL